MKIQMRPHLKFPSRGKPQGNRIFPSCGKRAGALFFGAGMSFAAARGDFYAPRRAGTLRAAPRG